MKSIQDQYIKADVDDMRAPLFSVLKKSCQYDVRIRSVDKRKLTDIKGNCLIDFASCNYLSFDQDTDRLLNAGVRAARKFGVHTSRARLMGYHELFTLVEARLADHIGVEDTILFPNTTLTGIGIIPALMKKDDLIILDKSAHAIMYQASQMARDKGAILKNFPQNDFDKLDDILSSSSARRKLICVDGVYSMTGDYASLYELQKLAVQYDALLYVDDGHGFATIGQTPDDQHPYGFKGNGIVKYQGLDYRNTMYVAGTAKGLSAAAAFASVTPDMKEYLMAYAKPLDYTHPPTPFAIGVLDEALNLLQEVGDVRRKKLYTLSSRLIRGLKSFGLYVMNNTHFPIISVWVGDTGKLIKASQYLFKRGIFLTSCPYPTMARGTEALRITVTSNNTNEEIDYLLDCFELLAKNWKKQDFRLYPECPALKYA